MQEQNKHDGLKKLRATTDRGGPQYACSNCGCKRYNPCGCVKKEVKKK